MFLSLGVADQLQTNYASELRHILRAVFDGYAIDRNIEVAEEALSLHLSDVSPVNSGNGHLSSSSEQRDDLPPRHGKGMIFGTDHIKS